MFRRYLVAFVGAVAGGAAVAAVYYFGLDSQPDYRAVATCGLAVAGFLMAKGESLGLVPAAEDLDNPASLFTDEKGRRR
jgi:hypothetical protein